MGALPELAVSLTGQTAQTKYQAAVARNNARIEDFNANIALARGQSQEQAQRLKTGALIGAQKAAFAGGNIDIAGGSPTDLFANTAMIGELDALTLRYNAESEALAHTNQAADFRAQRDMIQQAGSFGMATSVLSTFNDVAEKWITFGAGG